MGRIFMRPLFVCSCDTCFRGSREFQAEGLSSAAGGWGEGARQPGTPDKSWCFRPRKEGFSRKAEGGGWGREEKAAPRRGQPNFRSRNC